MELKYCNGNNTSAVKVNEFESYELYIIHDVYKAA